MDDFGIRGAFFSFEIEDWNIEFKNKIINQLQLGKFWKKKRKTKSHTHSGIIYLKNGFECTLPVKSLIWSEFQYLAI